MILDNRGLQPPEPMMRTLKALEELESGKSDYHKRSSSHVFI